MFAFPRERFGFGPRLDDQSDRFALAAARFARSDVVGEILVRHAAHEARDQPASAHDVQHRIFLGDPDRIEHRNEIADHRELGVSRPVDQCGADQIAVGHHPVGTEMVLVASEPIEAAFFRIGDAVDVVLVELPTVLGIEVSIADRPRLLSGQTVIWHGVKEAEFHRAFRSFVTAKGEPTIMRAWLPQRIDPIGPGEPSAHD